MDFFLLDYSAIYYSALAGTPVPEKRSGKFVQIRNSSAEYLVLSPREFSPYHANVTERFCTQNEIAGTYNNRKDHFGIFEPDWEIIGGGAWEMDEAAKMLRLSGFSQAYGKFDSTGLKERLLSVRHLAGYQLRIE
ncbi:MAG: hypothetical protein HZA17_10965 [Nitrospirae bacterium]|nr:hypothetical protein [Nitrospirota bacterium]